MRLPLFTIIAPVASSLVLWLVLGNPAVLLLAMLGPLMAVGSFLDARRTARRREAEREAERELEQARRESAERAEWAGTRAEAEAEHPPVSWFVREGAGIPPRWAHSELPEHRQLRVGVDTLTRMPVVLDVVDGVAIVAQGVVGTSVWRALMAAMDWMYSPTQAHEERNHGLISMYAEKGMVPSNASLVMHVQDDATAVLTDFRRLTGNSTMLDVDLLTRPEFETVRARIENTRAELALSGSAVAGGSFGVAELDVVRQGPHALLVGMTGSGKTEFLVSWLTHLADVQPPDELNILLLDYKGGVGLGRLRVLPHVVGLVSDLSPALAERVLVALRAEIRSRERVLAKRGTSDVVSLPPRVLPRLIVVIDEYRALLEATPAAAAVFADLASRGRALGIHLILSTQQLGGLSESILANCGLRVCFRMTAAHDSRTLLGSDASVSLPHQPGTALVVGTGLELTTLSFSITDAERLADITQASRAWVDAHPHWAARTPWCEPLPAVLTQLPAALAAVHNPRTPTALSFGLSDVPHEQRQELAVWDPAHDGHLHVQGGLGSGRTAVLRTLTAAAHDRGLTVLALTSAEQLWDCIVSSSGVVSNSGVSESLTPGGDSETGTFVKNTLIVIDDLDAVIAEFGIEHREAFLATLQIRLRTAPAQGSWFIIATLDHGSSCAWLSQLVRTSLVLAAPQRGREPGLTTWHGNETRVVHASQSTVPSALATEKPPAERAALHQGPTPEWHSGQSYIIVTHRVRQVIRQIIEQGVPRDALHDVGLPITVEASNPAHPRIYVGDIDSWQAKYNLLGTLRREATIIVDGCTPSEVRSLRLHRGLLPYSAPGRALAVTPDGHIHRRELARGRGEFGQSPHAA